MSEIFSNDRPLLELLSKEEIETIHISSLRTLEDVGIMVDNENALKLFTELGADVDPKKKIVRVPEHLVKEAIKRAPSSIKMYSRDRKFDMLLTKNKVHYNPGSAALYVLDRETGKPRRPLSKDFREFVRLVDAMENIHAQSTAMVVSDVPEIVTDRYRLYIVLKNSTKTIVTGAFTIEGVHDMKKMLETVVGGEKELRKKPLAIFDVCPSPPLKWSEITSQNLIDCAKFEIPAEVISMPQVGATGPATLAGSLVQFNAEFLCGLVMSQMTNPGAPIIYGGSPSILDMRFGTGRLASIEAIMLCCAYAQLGKYYNLPTHAYLGLSDTKTVDAQAGMEAALGLVLGALAGINNIAGPGMLSFENCQSFEKLVIDNEICGYALRLVRGIQVNEETLALDVIEKVGPGGHFLGQKHTRKWFKIEEYMPSYVIDARSERDWFERGAKDIVQRAKERVDEVLREHEPEPLPPDVEKELDNIALEILKK
ncbi:MAG: trimethylamine methyltransferase family protein, partial [Candidatus Odinarchaeota archaeon]|nr:trimethylamine methyltransferase family protein [Candidatus Odinarchaeota archaeon]